MENVKQIATKALLNRLVIALLSVASGAIAAGFPQYFKAFCGGVL